MKVSIVTISFNQGRFLEACIRSVLEQDYPNIEYIVVDPGSTDESRAIIGRYADRIAKVVLEPDDGPADGLNNGFRVATGEIFGFINADDVLLPGAVSTLVQAFKSNPGSDVVFGHGMEIDEQGDLIQRVWSTSWNLKAHAYRTALTVQPATFFRADAFRRLGGFNAQNRTCWDAELFVDLGRAGARFFAIPEFIGAYRMYPGTVSSEVTWGDRGALFEAENRRIFEKIMDRSPTPGDRWVGYGYYFYKQIRQPLVALKKLRFKLSAPKQSGYRFPAIRLVWFGGYPAHYMGEFHQRLESAHEGLFFVYVPLGKDKNAFAHERTQLPKKYVLLSGAAEYLQAWRWLNRLNPEAVLITGNFPRVNLLAAFWAWMHGKSLHYLADSNLLDSRNLQRNWINRLFLRFVLRKASKLLCIGSCNREFYLAQCGKQFLGEHLHHMPLPHRNEAFEKQLPKAASPFVFLVFGRLDAIKAVDRVIAAYALLGADAHAKSRLLIAGDGPESRVLQAQVSALGLDSHVEFLGAVPSDRAQEVFGEANAVVMASHDEPWGLVVNEALSAGKPVIGPFWIGAFADLVIPGKTGLVTMGNDATSLAEAMRQLLEAPASAEAMGLAGRAHVREQGWTIDGSLQAFRSLLEPLKADS